MKKNNFALFAAALMLLITATAACAEDWPMFRANVNRTGTNAASLSAAAFSGQKDWTVKLPDKIQSSPAIYNTLAIFGSNDGKVYALDLHSGETVWTFSTGN